MDKKFVIHLGAHKTATTAIQHYCDANLPELNKSGLVYAGFTAKTWSTYRTLRNLCESIRGEGEFTEGQARLKFLVDKAGQTLDRPNVRLFLVPWEVFLGEPYVEGRPALYPHARNVLEAIAEALRELPVKVVYTIRDQWSFLNSWYLMIHKLGRVPDPEAYRQWALQSDISWKPLVDALHEMFGRPNVQVLRYDPAVQSSGAYFREVFDAYGYSGPLDLEAFERKNLSWPAEAIEIARHAMPLLPNERERYLFRLKLDEVFRHLQGRPLKILDEETRRLFEERYGKENRALVSGA